MFLPGEEQKKLKSSQTYQTQDTYSTQEVSSQGDVNNQQLWGWRYTLVELPASYAIHSMAHLYDFS